MKIKIESVEAVKKKIESLGVKWEKAKTQADSYFRLKDLVGAVQKPGSYILRIRRDTKNLFTLKALTDRQGVWDEYETRISDPDQLEKILKRIDFVNVLTLHKTRTSGKYKDFGLEIDEIKELGDYLEAEAIGTDGEKLQEEIKKFFLNLGLKEKNIER